MGTAMTLEKMAWCTENYEALVKEEAFGPAPEEQPSDRSGGSSARYHSRLDGLCQGAASLKNLVADSAGNKGCREGTMPSLRSCVVPSFRTKAFAAGTARPRGFPVSAAYEH